MGDATCTTCSIFRPDSAPRVPNFPPICDGDRALMDRHLTDIANLIADLSNDEEPVIDGRQHERFGTVYFKGNLRHVFSRGMFPSDPLASLGGVAPINSRTKQPSVSGSRERPIPIPVHVVDLKAGARVPNPSPAAHDWPEDQIGHLSAATVLDQWVRDIRDTLWPDQHLPEATVDQLVLWLRNRVQDICDRHPAVVEFAEEIRSLRSALRLAAKVTEARPELCEGVACPQCDLRAMMHVPGDTYRAQCADCGTLLTDEEYAEVVKAQDAIQRAKRSPEEIHLLLRRV